MKEGQEGAGGGKGGSSKRSNAQKSTVIQSVPSFCNRRGWALCDTTRGRTRGRPTQNEEKTRPRGVRRV